MSMHAVGRLSGRRDALKSLLKNISKCLTLAMLLAIYACSLFPDRPPSPALHDFGSSDNFTGKEKADWSSVSVDAPEWLQNENIRYRLLYDDPTRVRFYSRDRWLAPPPSLLAQRLSLEAGGRGFRLKIRMLEFEQVFDGPQTARVVLAFRAVAERPGTEEIAGEKFFRFALPTSTPDAKGAVTAFAALVEEAVKSLKTWLAALPAQP